MNEDFPKLRPLEAIPRTFEGKPVLILRDPWSVSDAILAVPIELVPMLRLLNGENSITDIQAALTRQLGSIVFREQIDQLVRQLDEALFLSNERFEKAREALHGSYLRSQVRPASHAGLAYPSDRTALLDTINAFYLANEGSGLPESRQEYRVRAAVLPHIDLRLAGPIYTHAYRRIAEGQLPDLFVILGTGHRGLPSLFSIAPKDFETPLGLQPFARDFASAVNEALSEPIFEDDYSHKSEHTIEFQVLFLQHLFQGKIPILPVLTSFSHSDLEGGNPGAPSLFERFTAALKKAEQTTGMNVCYLASVDLAHIGPAYGDSYRPAQSHIDEVCRKDLELLSYVAAGDATGFQAYISQEEDCRRVCGFPAILTMLHLATGIQGQLWRHGHAVVDDQDSFVTFASLTFEEPTKPNGMKGDDRSR